MAVDRAIAGLVGDKLEGPASLRRGKLIVVPGRRALSGTEPRSARVGGKARANIATNGQGLYMLKGH
jgi:hypothetical protein